MLSTLQLDRYFIDSFKIETVCPQGNTPKLSDLDIKVDWDVFAHAENKNLFKIVFNLKINTDKVKKTLVGYILDMSVTGLFSINPAVSDEKEKMGLIQFNAPAMLYSTMRGLVSLLTGNCFFGPLHIPTLNIQEIAESQSKLKMRMKNL